jgi:aldehyde:ferredoxin oxidoreductase
VDNYVTIYKAVTGREFDKKRLIEDSERVYNFQRVFNLRRGFGTRIHDRQPYRAAGPVTKEEYESRAERYDKQLMENVGIKTEGMTTEEKMKILRKYREERYEGLLDAVYKRRGWNNNGVPTIDFLKKIGMDLPEVIDVVKNYQ